MRPFTGFSSTSSLGYLTERSEEPSYTQPDNSRQRSQIEADWPTWYAAVFGSDFVAALAPHHREAIEWHWEARQSLLKGESPDYLAYFSIWSRGHMKSTIARRMAVCDAALSISHGSGGYCLYVSGTKPKVRGHAISIESLITSPAVARYYPELGAVRRNKGGASKGWTSDFIYTKGGYVFHFIGLDQGVAGANVDDIRPTLIIPDDIDDREDSPAISESRFQVFTKSVLPTRQRDTVVFLAQNLISRYSVVYRIWKQRARVLTNRKLTDPIPAVRNLKTEPRTVGGLVKDVVLAGEPTWAFYDLQRVQEEIDTMGLPAFEAECQHNVEQNKAGLILQEWDERVHIITWSEFADVYGERSIPKHWRKYVGHDWGNTHPCVISGVATAAENSRLPGLHFVFGGLSFPQNTLADDVALATIERFAPHINTSPVRKMAAELLAKWSADRVTDILDAPRQAAQRVVKAQVETWLSTDPSWVMWHMSHEQANVRGIYREFYGLPWQPCNPKAAGGIEQFRHFLRVDYSQPHPFRQGAKGLAGLYFIVDEDQLEGHYDDFGLHLWREQFPEWFWRDPVLTETGQPPEKPIKLNDDCGNSLMMVFNHFSLMPQPLGEEERREQKLPERLRIDAARRGEVVPDDGWIASRRRAMAEVRREEDEESGSEFFDVWNNTV